ncbi:MAG: para-aminobenzoate synthetase component 1 [Paraglaciecola sp.]|jgi:para-aminobenzoate synthetase component 1
MKTNVPAQITITALNLPKESELLDVFQHYAAQDWAMLLDSANSTHEDGRYDIFVAQPIATLTTLGESSTLWRQASNNTVTSNAEPLGLLQELLDENIATNWQTELVGIDLPFMVGALGYFGYDLGRRFETLPDTGREDYQTPDMSVGIYSWSVIKDNLHSTFYLCALEPHTAPTVQYLQALADKQAEHKAFSLIGEWQSNMQQAEYVQNLDKIDGYLRAGDCYQVNLAQRFNALYQGDEWSAYMTLRTANKAHFSAFLRIPDATIISISPERFLSVNEQQVQSKPIKGTRPRSPDPQQDQSNIDALIHSAKDQAENLMIVDLLRNDLSKNCQPGSVKVPELFVIESFAAVHHLVSTVTGRLNEHCSPLTLLQDAFPGGSITGAPKIRAMQIIDELEPHKRNIYCGSIGYIGIKRDMDTSICIRTLLCEEGKIYCWAGGGIVIDSDPQAEYQESLDKVSKILPLLINHTSNSKTVAIGITDPKAGVHSEQK